MLIPSRNNLENLTIGVNSFIENTNNLENIEILIGYDFDDPIKDQYEKSFGNIDVIKLHEFKVRHGYYGLNLYYNELIAESSGDYMMVCNDDVRMLTENWDDMLQKYENRFNVIQIQTMWLPHPNGIDPCVMRADLLFPIFPKKWVDVTGRIAGNAHNDSWISQVIGFLDKNFKINDIVSLELDIMVKHDTLKATTDKESCNSSVEFFQLFDEMEKDAAKLGEFLKNNE